MIKNGSLRDVSSTSITRDIREILFRTFCDFNELIESQARSLIQHLMTVSFFVGLLNVV